MDTHSPDTSRSPRSVPPKPPRPEPAPRTTSAAVVDLERRIGQLDGDSQTVADGRRNLAEEFWASHPSSPLLEETAADGCTVTFLWRDAESEEVLLFVNRLTDESDLAASLMDRVPGTDVWHLSYRMSTDWRASYSLHPRPAAHPWPWDPTDHVSVRRGLDHGLPDPLNRRRQRNRAGEWQSVVSLPDAPPQPWLEPRPGIPRTHLGEHLGPGGRRLWVGASGNDEGAPLPVVIAFDGDAWCSTQDLASTVDNLVAEGLMRACLLVLVDSAGRDRRWADLGGAGGAPDWIADELLPWVRAHLAVSSDPDEVVVVGQSLGALTALQVVLERPDAARRAISQSPSLWRLDLGPLVEGRDLSGMRIHQEVGLQEWVLLGPNREFAHRLVRAGAQVEFVEYNGGHDYACWRGGVADGLTWVLPPQR